MSFSFPLSLPFYNFTPTSPTCNGAAIVVTSVGTTGAVGALAAPNFLYFRLDALIDAEVLPVVESSRMLLKMLTRPTLGMCKIKARNACSTTEAGQLDGSGSCLPIVEIAQNSACDGGTGTGGVAGVRLSVSTVSAAGLDPAADPFVVVSLSSNSR